MKVREMQQTKWNLNVLLWNRISWMLFMLFMFCFIQIESMELTWSLCHLFRQGACALNLGEFRDATCYTGSACLQSDIFLDTKNIASEKARNKKTYENMQGYNGYKDQDSFSENMADGLLLQLVWSLSGAHGVSLLPKVLLRPRREGTNCDTCDTMVPGRTKST